MKWWGLMKGSFTPAAGYMPDTGEILSREKFNLGDNIISDSELRMIGGAENPDDVLMIRGTSCFRNQIPVFWQHLHPLMDEAQKVVMWSVGIGPTLPQEMPEDFYRALPRISHFGVRGPASKMLLLSHGVPSSKITVTYCPTLLRGVLQGFRYEMKKPTDIRTVVIGTWNGPLPEWLETLADRFQKNGCRVILHLQDHRSGWEAVHDGNIREELKPLFDKYEVAMSRSPGEFDSFIRKADLVMGVKLHCNLPALAWGIPTYTFTNDWRLKEILQPQGIPLLHTHQTTEFPGYCEKDFIHMPGVISACWQRNAGFLHGAGINFDSGGLK